MKRTKSRPLVTGEISTTQAVAYALSTSVVGIGLLAFYVNVLTALLGIFALFAYVVLYGYAKRRSYHGTLVGSISGSMPLVAGYTAATGELDTTAAMLFIVMALWQVPHFYAIAIYRKEEYAAAKLPIISVSKSIRLAVLSMKWYVAAFLLSVWTLWLVAEGSGYIYLAVITIVSALWLVKCFQRLGDTSRWAKGGFWGSLIVLLVFNALIATWQILP